MVTPDSSFALAVCHVGAERWLKAEVARKRPDLHPGFQRPGLVSFKATEAPFRADEVVSSVFARMWACSAGPCVDVDAVLEVATRVGARDAWVGPRDVGQFGEAPDPVLQAAAVHAAEVGAALTARGLRVNGGVVPGAVVLDVVTAPGETSAVGWHTHALTRHLTACGRLEIVAPADAPSRAWVKMREGIAWSKIPLRPGQTVIEIGSMSSGSTRALVDLGLRVVAVDPRPLTESLASNPSVSWVRSTLGEVSPDALPVDATWIACDANVPPAAMIRGLRRLLPRWRRTVRGMLLTFNLNDEETVAALPRLLEQVRGLGFGVVRATQLPSNRRDVFVVAVREG